MTHSHRASALIAKWEGFEPKAYRCPAGLPTIGYGHVIQKGEVAGRMPEMPSAQDVQSEAYLLTATLTQEQAMNLLEKDLLSRYTPELNRLCAKAGAELTQNQFDACLSFLYNCGPANLERSNILGFVKAGKLTEAVRKLGLYTKAKTAKGYVDLPGLIKRRKEEAELFAKNGN